MTASVMQQIVAIFGNLVNGCMLLPFLAIMQSCLLPCLVINFCHMANGVAQLVVSFKQEKS